MGFAVDRITAEFEASSSLTTLLQLARECKQKHESAGLPLPPPLQRLFGTQDGNGTIGKQPVITIPPISRLHVPDGVTEEWISIAASDATPTTVALGILRGAQEPMSARELGERVVAILPEVSPGSVYNLAARLAAEKVLDRADDGTLSLIDRNDAPILDAGFIWGVPAKLAKQDVAAHRREVILHILGMETSGLQIVQLVAKLDSCRHWMKAPANKDLVKDDIAFLSRSRKISTVGHSRKWRLTRET
jgi:hypothetical protein